MFVKEHCGEKGTRNIKRNAGRYTLNMMIDIFLGKFYIIHIYIHIFYIIQILYVFFNIGCWIGCKTGWDIFFSPAPPSRFLPKKDGPGLMRSRFHEYRMAHLIHLLVFCWGSEYSSLLTWQEMVEWNLCPSNGHPSFPICLWDGGRGLFSQPQRSRGGTG